MKVPFLDLSALHESIRHELDAAIDNVIRTGAFVGGKTVAAFEQHFAEATGARAAVGCNSGTDALSLALRGMGVGPGDEVIVPSMTFIATAEAVTHVGATPVLADVSPDDLLLTEESVADVRTAATRAVVPVHLYGNAVPFSRLQTWRDDGLLVLEDAAQAHLATWEGLPIGSVGHATAYSFYPGKNLGAMGDAGAVTSDDPAILDEVRLLRDHGRTDKYRHDVLGVSSRLDGMQAAILDVKLRHLSRWTDERRRVAAAYRQGLGDLDVLIDWADGTVHHLLVMRGPADREGFRTRLADTGVANGVHYPIPLSRQPSMKPFWRDTPVSEAAADDVVSLPIDPAMSGDQVEYVVDVVRQALA